MTDANSNGAFQAAVSHRPIAVYGASGFTGRHVARALAELGGPVVLAGRDQAKLDLLAAELGGDCVTAVAPLDDPAAMRAALKGCAAVISCAGPFALYGEPVVRAAVEAGAHYLDVSGEQSYIRDIFQRYGPAAKDAGVALIPAVGIDCVPADMLAALAAQDAGPLDRITVVIDVSGGRTNVGSLLTMLDAAHRREGVVYRDGEFRPTPRSVSGGTWDFGRSGRVLLTRFAGAEVVLLPRQLDTKNVDVFFTAGSTFPRWFPQRLGRAMTAGFEGVARSRAYPFLRRRLARMPAPKGDIERISVEVEISGRNGVRRGFLTAKGGYRFTALAASRAAACAAAPGFHGSGPLTPALAFDARTFLDALVPFDVEYRIDDAWVKDAVALAG